MQNNFCAAQWSLRYHKRWEFNIQKQRDTYDPEGAFIRRWCAPERK